VVSRRPRPNRNSFFRRSRKLHYRPVAEARPAEIAEYLHARNPSAPLAVERVLVAKLAGIVGSRFAHVDYGEAIQVLERSNQKFEFPVQ